MSQDYYFNSHNPNRSNNNGGTPPPKKPNSNDDKNQTKEAERPQNKPGANNKRPVPNNQGGARSQGQPVAARPNARQATPRIKPKGTSKRGQDAGQANTPKEHKYSAKLNFLRVLFGSFIVCGVTGLVVALTVLIYSINVVNGEIALNLDVEKYDQAQTTFIYGTNEKDNEIELARLHGTENRIWVDMKDMSPYMQKAFIALEDKRFEKHNGVDWFRTLSSIIVHRGTQGGSTITQQLIKNLTDQNSVTFVRKFNEILTALNLEKHFEKDEIVEAYMNTIFLSQGCYGVQTASITYFGKDISELNLAECAAIAAITQWPSRYDPLRSPQMVKNVDGVEEMVSYVEKNKNRQKICLDSMLAEEMITQEEYDEAINFKLVFSNSPEYKGKSAAATAQLDKNKVSGDYNSYYVDFVIQQVAEKLAAQNGITLKKAQKMVINGGYKIYAAMDYTVQKTLEDVYSNYTKMPDHTVQSAMTVMDYKGKVVGIVGGTGTKTGDMVLNRASQSPRQPGSTMKPIGVYAPALELNAIYWSSMFSDTGSRKSGEEPQLKGNGWPHNDGGGTSGSTVTVQYALQKSLNTVPVRILTDIGFEASMKFSKEKAHLSYLTDQDLAYSPLALGGSTKGETSLEMTTAYQMFGNGGYYYAPYSFTKVVNSRNEIVFESKPEETKQQAMSPANATVMNKMLQTVAGSGGSGNAYNLGSNYEMIAKTGTTSESVDRWYVGGTPYYIATVWYGYDEQKTIYYNLSSNPAGTLWNTVMGQIHKKKNLKAAKFEVSSDAVSRKYCTSTGLLARNTCSSAVGYYDANHLPGTCKGNHGGGSNNNVSTTKKSNSNSTDEDDNKKPDTTAPKQEVTAAVNPTTTAATENNNE